MSRMLGPGIMALVIKVASAFLTYLMLILFSHLLTTADYGHFGLILNLSIVLAAVIGLGLPTAVLRFWPEHMAKGEVHLAKGFMRGAVYAITLGSLPLLVIAELADYTGFGPPVTGLTHGLLVAALLATLVSIGDFSSAALRAQGLTWWALFPRDIFWRLSAPLAATFFAQQTGHISLATALACTLLTLALALAVQLWILRGSTRRATGHVKPEMAFGYWSKSLVPFAGSSLIFAMVQQLDVVVVGALAGPVEAGAYFAAQKTASLLGLVMIAGGLVAAPLMSSAFHSGKTDDLRRICRLLALSIASTTLAGFLVVALIGPRLLMVFDPHYVTAYPTLLILASGFCIDALAGPSAYLMQMTGLERPYVRLMAIVYALVLALQIFLVPRYGVVSAAVASAAGVCLWNVISVAMLRRKIGIDPSLFGVVSPVKAGTP